jgi:ABC-type transport system substrate-binding protein
MFMYSNQGFPNWESIEATGEYEVTLTLIEPNATQLLVLSRPDGAIISPATLDAGDFTNPAMAGPFQVERFVPGQEAVITRFEGYWQEELPYLDQVIIRAYPDEASILAALEAGEVDMTLYAPFTSVPRIQEGAGDLRIEVGEPLVNLFMGANVELAPLDNPLVRQAVNYAVDREAIIEVALNGLGEAPASILAPNDLGFDASLTTISTYDPAQAEALLAESGLELPIEITLSFENNRFWPLMAELIEVDLEAVGFDVTLERLDTGSFWGKANDGELQLSINQRSTFVPDLHGKAIIVHSTLSPGGQTHHEGLENAAEIDALIDAGIATADPAERAEIYGELQSVLLDAAPYTYLAYLTPPIFVASRVQNVDTSGTAAGRVDFREVWVTDAE